MVDGFKFIEVTEWNNTQCEVRICGIQVLDYLYTNDKALDKNQFTFKTTAYFAKCRDYIYFANKTVIKM